jgi:hypothetical protein
MSRRKATQAVAGCLVFGLVAGAFADRRVDVSHKGSVLVFSKVEIKWRRVGENYVVSQDTFLDVTNDYPADVQIQVYMINGDLPTPPIFVGDPPALLERAHMGWNSADCQFRLTANQPTFWSILTGLPAGCQPFTVLDPGFPPGRPDPDGPAGARTLRGMVVLWAVDIHGEEIAWNHLTGDATIVNYTNAAAWGYSPYAFAAVEAAHGDPTDDMPGQLLFNGREFETSFDRVQFDFYAVGSTALSGGGRAVFLNSDLTLHPVTIDLRQDTFGPVSTIARFDIWNQNETRFSGTEKRITCWDETQLSRYGRDGNPNHFMRTALQTEKGRARIDGIASVNCETRSLPQSLLGVVAKQLSFLNGQAVAGSAEAGITLVGQGQEDAGIVYDLLLPPSDAQQQDGERPKPGVPEEIRPGAERRRADAGGAKP